MANNKVMVSYVHPSHVNAEFMRSFLGMIAWDISYPDSRRLIDPGGWFGFMSGSNVAGPRNATVKHFLEGEADWFLTIDTDMVFPPWAHYNLINRALQNDIKILSGLYWGIKSNAPQDGTALIPPVGYYPQTWYWPEGVDNTDDGGYTKPLPDPLPENGLVKVDGAGAGCLLVHREVFVAIEEKKFSTVFPWFQETEHNGHQLSEDLEFCWRAGECGYEIYVDTSLELAHIKDLPVHSQVMVHK